MATSLKDEIHQLVDHLPESELPYVRRFLEYVRAASAVGVRPEDPLLRALAAAPVDDEPETEAERAAVQVAREQAARGEVVSDAALWERLGHAPARRVDARRRS